MPELTRPILLRTMAGILACAVLAPALASCASAEIALRERFGQAKREQLVDRVEEARDEQTEAKEQFETTLAEFKSLTGFDGGDLEQTYNRLNAELKRSRRQAGDVSSRIRDVERVAEAMFSEWDRELDQFQSPTLRDASAAQLEDTRGRYTQLIGAMKKAEGSMEPVLAAFSDQVLLLKHNLNARAIASLEQNVSVLEGEIERLILEMEASIAEADRFISELAS